MHLLDLKVLFGVHLTKPIVLNMAQLHAVFIKKRIEKRWIFSVSLILSSFSINAFYTQQISTLQNFLEHFQNSSYSFIQVVLQEHYEAYDLHFPRHFQHLLPVVKAASIERQDALSKSSSLQGMNIQNKWTPIETSHSSNKHETWGF